MMRPAICCEMLYPDADTDEKIRLIHAAGFDAVEFWGHKDKDLEKVSAQCRASGVQIVNFSAHRATSPIDAKDLEGFVAEIRESAAIALGLGCPMLMALSNALTDDGRVVDSYDRLSAKEKLRNFVRALRAALEALPAGIGLVIEPLNTLLDHPGNYLKDVATAVRIADAVGDPRLGILCDFYHMRIMGFSDGEIVERYGSHIRHVHIADLPDRTEPHAGKGGWEELLKRLADSGYSGYVGFEYRPRSSSDASLAAIRELWTRIEKHSH